MKRVTRKFAAFFILILLLIPVMQAAETTKNSPPMADSMSIWQARRTVIADFVAIDPYFITADPGSFRFTLDSFEFDGKLHKKNREHFKIDLKSLEPVFIKKSFYGYRAKNEAGGDLPAPLPQLVLWRKGDRDPAAFAESFAAALNRLRAFAGDQGSALRDFPRQAAAWRALPSKPPIPEEVRAQRLLAENAVKQKNLENALDHYETGLELYPTWPQGYFNAALVAAELGFYAEAVEHMRAYLELVPDAADAQSARDQIVIWQDNAIHLPPAQPGKPPTEVRTH